MDELLKNISDFINQSFDKISEEIYSLVNITNFQFLNMNFSIQNYLEEILNETFKSIKNIKINEIITNIYNEYFETMKNKIKNDLDNIYKLFDKEINYEFERTSLYYQNQKYEGIGKLIIKEIHPESKDILYKSIQNLFLKINEVYSSKNINEILIKNQNNVLKEYIFELNNEDLSNYIKDDINQLSQINYNRLIQEKNIFQNNIKILYEKSFNNILSEFFNNKGKEYLNKIKKGIDIPIITNINKDNIDLLELELKVDEIYNLITNRKDNLYKKKPIIKDNTN